MLTQHDSAARPIATFTRVLSRTLAIIASPLGGWWTRVRIHDDLMAMDDRMLADIGISRCDIPAVAAGRYQAETIGLPQLAAGYVRRSSQPQQRAANDRAEPRVA